MTDDSPPDLDGAYALRSPDGARRLYADWAESYDADFVAATGYRIARRVAEIFRGAGGRSPVLDVGCGTGAVALALPEEMEIDGIDLSPEMLAVAARTGRYGALVEADLTQDLPALPRAPYGGLVSAGTFTHGHVGPDALPRLVEALAPGGWFVFSTRPELYLDGFEETLEALAGDGLTSLPLTQAERIYENAEAAPEGHGQDMALIVTVSRL